MDRDYARLAAKVKEARIRRYRTVDAARGTVLSRGAWDNVERGGSAKPLTYAGVEERLGWAYGDCERILAGGEPTPVEPLSTAEAVRQSNLSPTAKAAILRMLAEEEPPAPEPPTQQNVG